MVRPQSQERIAIKKIACDSVSKKRCMLCHAGPRREAPGLVRRQRERGESLGKSLCCGFCEKGKARQGEQTWDCLDNFRRLWAVGVVSSCQMPGSGVI